MFELSALQYNTENPTLVSVLFTILFSLGLGIIIAFTYEKTSRSVARPNHFLQALVLITIVAAVILQAIGDSVARGLGMLGALSIIRFRTTIRSPRNIVFMFASIAAGIACGVLGYVIAIVGTLGFALTAFILRYSSFSTKNNLIGFLKLDLPKDYEHFDELEGLLNKYSQRYTLMEYKVFTTDKKENLVQYDYHLKLKKTHQGGHLVEELKRMEGLKVVSLLFRNQHFDQI